MTPELVTRDQLARLFAEWGVTEKPPGKGKRVTIAWGPGMPFRLATVTPHPRKSTYGKALFAVEFSNPEGGTK